MRTFIGSRERGLSDVLRSWGLQVVALMAMCSMPMGALAGTGDLDQQFGSSGHLEVTGNSGPNVLEFPDGRVVVIGTNAGQPSDSIVIDRFLPSGQPDASFGDHGRRVVVLPVADLAISAVAWQPDGKIILAGRYGSRPFVARVEAGGALDEGFGAGGVAEPGTNGGTEPFYSSVLVLAEGDILATISDWTNDRLDHWDATGRYLGNLIRGAIAPTRAARQSDGRLIMTGYDRTLERHGVVRFESDGSVDRTFGDDGFAALDVGYMGNVSVEPATDRIVLCGPGLVRLTADGHLDTTFGVQGTGYVPFGSDSVPAFDYCNRLLAMWDGGVVFIGIRSGEAGDGSDLAFTAGLTSAGMADLRFGSGSGESAIQIGAIHGARDWWFDYSSTFVRTHDGDALLTWMTDTGLQLARIELNGGGGTETWPATPPPPQPPQAESPPPSPSPSTPTISEDRGSGGGGGALGWLDLALLAFGGWTAIRSRRRAQTMSSYNPPSKSSCRSSPMTCSKSRPRVASTGSATGRTCFST